MKRPWMLIAASMMIIAALSAWGHSRVNLARARRAADADDLQSASRQLDEASRYWPAGSDWYLLAARISRRTGDLYQAKNHLARCRYDDSAEYVLEEELFRAWKGDLGGDLDAKLLAAIRNGHPEAALICEALARGYLAAQSANGLMNLLEVCTESPSRGGWRGRAFYFLGRLPEAVADLAPWVEHHPADDEARFQLAHASTQAGFAGEGLRQSRFLAERKDSTPALTGLALGLQDQAKFEDEIVALDHVLAREPGNLVALVERGRALLRLGKPAAGEASARQAIAVDDSNADAHLVLGCCLEAQGRTAEGKAEQNRWQVLDAARYHLGLVMPRIASTNDPALMAQAAKCFLHLGQTQQMLEMCDHALSIDPDHRPTHRLLADYYARTGGVERARMHREAAAKP